MVLEHHEYVVWEGRDAVNHQLEDQAERHDRNKRECGLASDFQNTASFFEWE